MQLVLNQSLKFHFNHDHTKDQLLLSTDQFLQHRISEPAAEVWFTHVSVLENETFYIVLFFSHFHVPLWYFMPLFE